MGGLKFKSGSCRCVIIGVPWRLRRLSLFSTRLNVLSTNKPPRAERAETDPRLWCTHDGTLPTARVRAQRHSGTRRGCEFRGSLFRLVAAVPPEPGGRHNGSVFEPSIRRISIAESELLGSSLETWEFHPLEFRICLSQTL